MDKQELVRVRANKNSVNEDRVMEGRKKGVLLCRIT
jgi:hypothetical protein